MTASGNAVRAGVLRIYTPLVSGRRPLKKETRLGLQSGYWAYARSNLTPRAASRSIWGVFATGSP